MGLFSDREKNKIR